MSKKQETPVSESEVKDEKSVLSKEDKVKSSQDVSKEDEKVVKSEATPSNDDKMSLKERSKKAPPPPVPSRNSRVISKEKISNGKDSSSPSVILASKKAPPPVPARRSKDDKEEASQQQQQPPPASSSSNENEDLPPAPSQKFPPIVKKTKSLRKGGRKRRRAKKKDLGSLLTKDLEKEKSQFSTVLAHTKVTEEEPKSSGSVAVVDFVPSSDIKVIVPNPYPSSSQEKPSSSSSSSLLSSKEIEAEEIEEEVERPRPNFLMRSSLPLVGLVGLEKKFQERIPKKDEEDDFYKLLLKKQPKQQQRRRKKKEEEEEEETEGEENQTKKEEEQRSQIFMTDDSSSQKFVSLVESAPLRPRTATIDPNDIRYTYFTPLFRTSDSSIRKILESRAPTAEKQLEVSLSSLSPDKTETQYICPRFLLEKYEGGGTVKKKNSSSASAVEDILLEVNLADQAFHILNRTDFTIQNTIRFDELTWVEMCAKYDLSLILKFRLCLSLNPTEDEEEGIDIIPEKPPIIDKTLMNKKQPGLTFQWRLKCESRVQMWKLYELCRFSIRDTPMWIPSLLKKKTTTPSPLPEKYWVRNLRITGGVNTQNINSESGLVEIVRKEMDFLGILGSQYEKITTFCATWNLNGMEVEYPEDLLDEKSKKKRRKERKKKLKKKKKKKKKNDEDEDEEKESFQILEESFLQFLKPGADVYAICLQGLDPKKEEVYKSFIELYFRKNMSERQQKQQQQQQEDELLINPKTGATRLKYLLVNSVQCVNVGLYIFIHRRFCRRLTKIDSHTLKLEKIKLSLPKDNVNNVNNNNGIGCAMVKIELNDSPISFIGLKLPTGHRNMQYFSKKNDIISTIFHHDNNPKAPASMLPFRNDHVFLLGDLGYMIHLPSSAAVAYTGNTNTNNQKNLLSFDGLQIHRHREGILCGFREGEVVFPPVEPIIGCFSSLRQMVAGEKASSWMYKKGGVDEQREIGYTGRILVRSRESDAMEIIEYQSVPGVIGTTCSEEYSSVVEQAPVYGIYSIDTQRVHMGHFGGGGKKNKYEIYFASPGIVVGRLDPNVLFFGGLDVMNLPSVRDDPFNMVMSKFSQFRLLFDGDWVAVQKEENSYIINHHQNDENKKKKKKKKIVVQKKKKKYLTGDSGSLFFADVMLPVLVPVKFHEEFLLSRSIRVTMEITNNKLFGSGVVKRAMGVISLNEGARKWFSCPLYYGSKVLCELMGRIEFGNPKKK